MCIEYITIYYSDRNCASVAKRLWQWTNVYWNDGCDRYDPVVLEFLLEFDTYQETNIKPFKGNLSKKDYFILKELYLGITDGNTDDLINRILMLLIEFNNACEYADFSDVNEMTLMIIDKM